MCNILYVILVLCVFLARMDFLQGTCAVFVHLGKDIPRCLFTSLEQARFSSPDCDIYLLTDEDAYDLMLDRKDFLEKQRVCLVGTHQMEKSARHEMFCVVNKINPLLRGGYWMYATKRFFVLYDFIRSYGVTDIFHLESDCMLYMDLERLLPLFTGAQIAAPFQSLRGCIPCFVFIKEQKSLERLVDHILEEMEQFEGQKPHMQVNDMQTLASFYRKWGKDFLLPLPTLMPEYSLFYPKRKSRIVMDNATPLSFLSLYGKCFPGLLFDAAGLGIWINGNDRKDTPLYREETIHARLLFDPSVFSFFWGKNERGQDAPYLSFKGKSYRIVNLHFHSKMPEDFAGFAKPLGEFPMGKIP